MTYEQQVNELAEKMARDKFDMYDTFSPELQAYTRKQYHDVAKIALAFTADKIRNVTFTDIEKGEPYLQSLGLIPTI